MNMNISKKKNFISISILRLKSLISVGISLT